MPVECKKPANEMAAKKTGPGRAGLHSAVILVRPAVGTPLSQVVADEKATIAGRLGTEWSSRQLLSTNHRRSRMDMREASGMTEASGLTTDQDGVENASESIPGTAKDMSGSPTPLDPDSAVHALLRPVARTDLTGATTVALDGVLARRAGGSTALRSVISHRKDSMPRKLKTFQTSLGFYDVAIAALHQ